MTWRSLVGGVAVYFLWDLSGESTAFLVGAGFTVLFAIYEEAGK